MTLRLEDHTITDGRRVYIAETSDAIRADGADRGAGLFLRAEASYTRSRHKFELGQIPDLLRFTLCHRDEPFWMRPKAGTRLDQVPPETQFFLAELRGGGYLLLVPLIGESFRFSLRANKQGRLELLGETGDSFAPGLGDLALFVATGAAPFALLERGAVAVQERLGTGPLRRDKPEPSFIDHFGWCTWDAFYQEVSAEKFRDGLARFQQSGVSPRFVILDDGWQSTEQTPTGEKRLTAFAANAKFDGDLAASVRMAKGEFGVETFLVWHAILGYWGGVDGAALPAYGVIDQQRHFGEGIMHHAPSHNEDWWGSVVGFVPAASIERFYDDYHRYLVSQGVDGVKVDNQATLEALTTHQGGRVPVTAAYRRALEASVAKHFDGRLINCMSNAQETWYGSPRSTLIRTSIDFFPQMPETHGAHLYTNAQVGLWFGEFMLPDWDMFQSGHEWGVFHAAGRAVSGGPIYVSDKPGSHDVALLRKLVCSDGSVLRCDRPGLPTLDNLCVDPTHDDVLLKIWNRNGPAGIVGVFNARFHADGRADQIAGSVCAGDVHGLAGSRFACYAHEARTLDVVEPAARRSVALGPRQFELFTFVPVERGFAAIGLADKFNSAGALRSVTWRGERSCELVLRDRGELLCYCEARPTAVIQAGKPLHFDYDAATRAVRVTLTDPAPAAVTVSW